MTDERPMTRRSVIRRLVFFTFAAVVTIAAASSAAAETLKSQADEERLWQLRNLGKAFFESDTTRPKAIELFREALDSAPDSARERLNYGLALLRNGQTDEGIAQLKRVQSQAPEIPHTWFNLGIEYKRAQLNAEAIAQFKGMLERVPEEAKSHYNLGVLYRLGGNEEEAIRHFLEAARIDPNLAAPHFQLGNLYRRQKRQDESKRHRDEFRRLKRAQQGAAIPEDLEWSIFSEILDVADPSAYAPPTPSSNLRLRARTLSRSPRSGGAGLLILDESADGVPDLLVWSEKGTEVFKAGSGKGTELFGSGSGKGTETSARRAEGASEQGSTRPDPERDGGSGEGDGDFWERDGVLLDVSEADFDNDGRSDLCLVFERGVRLMRRVADGYQEHPVSIPPGQYAQSIWLDFDHDSDLDLFLLGKDSRLMRNNGEAGFGDESQRFPFAEGEALLAVAYDSVRDWDGIDLVVVYSGRTILYRDRLGGLFEATAIESAPTNIRHLRAEDLDNDGWTDLVAATDSGLTLLFNKGGRRWEAQSMPQLTGPLALADISNRGLLDIAVGTKLLPNLGNGRFGNPIELDESAPIDWAAADFDQDGRVELAALNQDGSIRILEDPQAHDQWVSIQLEGVRNLKSARGAKVEVKAGSLYQKRLYTGSPLHFGLDGRAELDTVRIIWPNGLIQNEPQQDARQMQSYKERQQLSGSCPMIFTWNGREFEFITDILGVAPLGARAGEDAYFQADHDEYIQISGDSLVPRNGLYEIRITEELREVAYLDSLALIAVDRPAHVDVFTNDKFKGPPFPEFRLFQVEERIPPVSARDHRGRDVRGQLLQVDRTYPDGFRRDMNGWAEEHWLELDFGARSVKNDEAILVLHGWLDWADGSTFLRHSQQGGASLIAPYLQVQDEQGRWRTAIEDMGLPAGKPKTIVVDLRGLFPSDSRRIRIVSSVSVYWDRIFLSPALNTDRTRLHSVPLDSSDLRFRGFSTPIVHPQRLQPDAFDYSRHMPLSMWNQAEGLYTRYGQVDELLDTADDRFVIMGSGDELQLLFRADALPPLPDGYRRDFLLQAVGWAKDGDLNTAHGGTVEPLPFRAMSGYPYPAQESYPNSEAHRHYRTKYLTRPALRLLQPLGAPTLSKEGMNAMGTDRD